MPNSDGSETSQEKLARILKPLHKPGVNARTGATPPPTETTIKSTGDLVKTRAQKLIDELQAKNERARILEALRKRTLSAEDVELAKKLGINLGKQEEDPDKFDL